MEVVSVAMATVWVNTRVVMFVMAHARRTMAAVLRHVRKERVRFINRDDTLVHRQDDADIELRHLISRA